MINRIYIIIINYNGIEDTKNCINSIYSNNKDLFDIRTIVVDNNSDSANKEKLKQLEISNPFVHVIINDKNLGFAKANNIGLKYIHDTFDFDDNSYLWFLNNDTLLNNHLFQLLKTELPNMKEVLYFEMRNFENQIVNTGLNYLNPRLGRYSETYKKNYIEYICGASIFLKYTQNVPLWNEDYFLYFEDVDYSIRLKRQGYIFKTIGGCWYNHKVNGSSNKNSRVNIFKLKSQKKFMKENGDCYPFFFVCKFLYLFMKGEKELLIEFIRD